MACKRVTLTEAEWADIVEYLEKVNPEDDGDGWKSARLIERIVALEWAIKHGEIIHDDPR